ncbi:SGSM1 protein, partial [Polypterus senegalus]
MKVGKSFPLAEELCRKAQELEQIIETKRNQIPISQESARKVQKLPNLSPQAIKHLWIRTALFEKVLDKIVHYLVENSRGILWDMWVICNDTLGFHKDNQSLDNMIQKRHSSGSMDDRPSLSARDYVESLHQNSRATLLYGKNNVLVQPRDDMEAIPGYLSLHQTADIMTLKWTPNQLMNGSVGDLDFEKRCE